MLLGCHVPAFYMTWHAADQGQTAAWSTGYNSVALLRLHHPGLTMLCTTKLTQVEKSDGSTNRHCVVEGGASVLCPAHIGLGDVVVVNTETGAYVGKV